jgi:hypothetical protein
MNFTKINTAKWTMNLSFIVVLLISTVANAQVYTNKEVGKKNEALADSLKKSEYKYVLPIWGKKVTEKGFSLPYSAGLSLNYFWQKSDLIIDNLMVGFNNGPMYELDEIVRFNKAEATASALTLRPDVWILPFLNVYGIFGKSMASTEVGFGVWIPDSTNTPKEVFTAESLVEFNTTSAGFGITPTMGVGGGWLALDMNFSWTDVPQLDKPAFVFIFGPRFGKTFKFKNPEQNIALWAGGFRVMMNSGTSGSINLSDVFTLDELEGKVDEGMQKVGDAQIQVDTWWEGLTPVEQKNPVNVAKYTAANAALGKAGEILNAADEAAANGVTSTVQYSMDKRPKDMWNFIVGSQYQLNKHFMVRAEVGFLSSRIQVNTGLQYRFGL